MLEQVTRGNIECLPRSDCEFISWSSRRGSARGEKLVEGVVAFVSQRVKWFVNPARDRHDFF
jgi:hypothetical protein